MVDYRQANSVGARIAAARKMRGIRSTKALADLIGNGAVSEATLQNIETGRLTNLSVSQLLNIAFALKVAPSLLLAAQGTPGQPVDLPNLSDGLAQMTVAEFDAWLTGSADGRYRATSAVELNERNELAALRDLERLTRERSRLLTTLSLDARADGDSSEARSWARTEQAIALLDEQVNDARRYLANAGWDVDSLSGADTVEPQ